MANGERVTLIVRTSKEFTEKFRVLDERYDELQARKESAIQFGDHDVAGKSAADMARVACEIQDLLFDELERHWGPRLIDDQRLPEIPDDWRVWVRGRLLHIEYEEREVFKDH
ncbi:MAG: hypothetical protein IPP14_14740 [Planctomycetes bacterium]|nr:hypothetical protein [Planctomycetota bacterium]